MVIHIGHPDHTGHNIFNFKKIEDGGRTIQVITFLTLKKLKMVDGLHFERKWKIAISVHT